MPPKAVRVASERRFDLLVVAILLSVGLSAAAFVLSVVVLFLTALGGLPLGAGIGWLLLLLVAVTGLGLLASLLVVGLASKVLRRIRTALGSTRRGLTWRCYRWVRDLEASNGLARFLRPSAAFARRGDDPLAADGPLVTALKERYVAGELDDGEFERELSYLLGDRSAERFLDGTDRTTVEIECERAGEPEPERE